MAGGLNLQWRDVLDHHADASHEVMIHASIDRPKLEKSLKRFAKEFGDSTATAVARWGVQVCREMALETLPWKTKDSESAKKQQQNAIERDLGRVCNARDHVSKARKKGDDDRLIKTPSEAISWMDENRIKNNRTRKLTPEKRRDIPRSVFNATVRLLMKNAGIAKGGFIGAGMEIAKAQKGPDRINIGKNFLSYAQKHKSFGSATLPRPGFSPSSKLTNRSRHTGLPYVLKTSAPKKAIDMGLKKTVKWYEKALKAQDAKQKI